MMVVALLALLAALGTPSLLSTLKNNQTIALTNDFVSAIHLTRSTAVTQRKPITICSSSSGTACTAGADWAVGYIVLDGSTVIKAQATMESGTTLIESANTTTLSFNGYGEPANAYQFTLKPGNCTSAAVSKRVISIGVTGRVTTSNVACP